MTPEALQTLTWALGVAFTLSLVFNGWIAVSIVALKTQTATLATESKERHRQLEQTTKKLDTLLQEFSNFRLEQAKGRHGE